MERVTLRVPDALLDDLDARVENGWFSNRSEAIRSGIRTIVENPRESKVRR